MLTIDYLKNEAQIIPSELKHLTEYVLAHLIIKNTLGKSFWDRELLSDGNTDSHFFRSRYEVRMLHTADLLWRLRNCRGFDEFIRKNGSQAFESTYFELITAVMISSSSDEMEFVLPVGIKGEDFDIRAKNFLQIENASIEIKNRRKPFTNKCSFRNYLNGIRKQLPNKSGGVIFCKLMTQGQTLTQEQITDVISNWLKSGTARVSLVVICWDPFEDDNLTIGTAYCIIGRNGITNQIIGSPISDNLTIKFLKDIGYTRKIDNKISVLRFARIGDTQINTQIIIDLGSWTSKKSSWWNYVPSL